MAIGVGAVGSLAAAGIGASATSSAAQEQLQAAQQAQQNTMKMFNTGVTAEQPYLSLGKGAASALATATGSGPGGNPANALLTAKFQPTMAQLAQTPGYQFTLQQGLEQAQSGFAAQGLASSGAALKGGSQYASGLAANTYEQQFNNNLQYQNQVYNMLQGETNTGAGAAGSILGGALTAAGQVNNAGIGGAAAGAAGQIGTANALTGGIGSATSGLTGLAGLNYLNTNTTELPAYELNSGAAYTNALNPATQTMYYNP